MAEKTSELVRRADALRRKVDDGKKAEAALEAVERSLALRLAGVEGCLVPVWDDRHVECQEYLVVEGRLEPYDPPPRVFAQDLDRLCPPPDDAAAEMGEVSAACFVDAFLEKIPVVRGARL